MGIAAAISAAATVGGSILSHNAADSAARNQVEAANKAQATQLKMYEQTRSDLSPFLNTGQGALSQLASIFGLGPPGSQGGSGGLASLSSLLSNFPGYQFGLNQGQQALDRSAASRGLLLSGAQLKDAQQFGQGYAMQQSWQPYISQLSHMADLGENAGAQVGNFGQNAGAGIAQSQLAAGQAQAAGAVGGANALSSGLENALLAYKLYGPSAGGSAGSGIGGGGGSFTVPDFGFG